MRAVAAGDVFALAAFGAAVWTPKDRPDLLALLERDECRPSFDVYARVGELRRQETLVGILRVVEHERVARQTGADVVERDAGDSAPASPQVGGLRHDAGRDDVVGKTELAIELQRARVHAKGARVRRDVVVAVDDANADAESRQHERKHQPRRPRADDEDLGRAGWVGHHAIQITKSAW